MKVAPVSADLLIKLALGVLVVGVAVYGISKVAGAASAAAGQVFDAAARGVDSISPLNHDNVFASGVNRAGGALVDDPAGPGMNADGSWSLGGWIYDVTH